MNKDQEAKNNTVIIVDDYCAEADNAALIDSFLTMKNDVIHFRQNKTDLNQQIQISQTDFTGNTTNQDNTRDQLAKYMADNICTISARYARSINNADLELVFKHSESQMKRYSVNSIIPFMKTIIDKAEDLLTNVPAYVTFTGMTTAIITEANRLKGVLDGYLGQAKLMQRAVRRSLHQIDVIQKDIWDHDFPNLIDDSHHFATSNPDFPKGLLTATKIDDLPTEHTGIQGFGHDVDGNVIQQGTITNLDMPDRAPMKFDNLGYYHDHTFQWGTYRYKYSSPGFVDQIITITIPRGRKIVQNVIMVAV
jgi:hypothetical protein